MMNQFCVICSNTRISNEGLPCLHCKGKKYSSAVNSSVHFSLTEPLCENSGYFTQAEGTSIKTANVDWRLLEPTVQKLFQNIDIDSLVQNILWYDHENSTKTDSLSEVEASHDFHQVSTTNWNLVPLNPMGNVEEYHNLIYKNCNPRPELKPANANPGYYIPVEDANTNPLNEDCRLLEPTIRICNQNLNNGINHHAQNVPSYSHIFSTGKDSLSTGKTYLESNPGSTPNWNLVPLNPSGNEREYRNLLYENCESLTKRRVVEAMSNPLEVSLQLYNKQLSADELIPKSTARRQEMSEHTEHLNASEKDGHASGLVKRKYFECQEGGKRLSESYNAHVQNNCDPKPYKCECGLEFRFPCHFMKHRQTTHSTEQLFKCEMCSFTSKWLGNLERHRIAYHTRK